MRRTPAQRATGARPGWFQLARRLPVLYCNVRFLEATAFAVFLELFQARYPPKVLDLVCDTKSHYNVALLAFHALEQIQSLHFSLRQIADAELFDRLDNAGLTSSTRVESIRVISLTSDGSEVARGVPPLEVDRRKERPLGPLADVRAQTGGSVT